MAVSVGRTEGALARANAEIRRTAPGKEDPRPARRALSLADQLLGKLEELLLIDYADVPSSCLASARAVSSAAIHAGVRDPRLETEAGVIRLMADVYDLEELLLRRLRVRTFRIDGRALSQGRREHHHAPAASLRRQSDRS